MFNKKAFSIIEYTILIVIIIGAFLVLRGYVQRGIYGMWGQAGQGFGFGRQYDPQKTIECAYDEQSNRWYDRNCFEQGVGALTPPCASGDTACEAPAISSCVVGSCSNVTGTDPT
jgi:hypothetical protein